MGHIALSLFAVIGFISAAYGTDCLTGSGITIQLNCPGKMDASKIYCCKFGTSNSVQYRCCDAEEYALQKVDERYTGGFTVNETIISPSYNQTFTYTKTSYGINGTGVGIILGILIIAIIPIAICLCCCFCPRCPCYRRCHPNCKKHTMSYSPAFPKPAQATDKSMLIQPAMLMQQPSSRNTLEGYTNKVAPGWVH